VILQHSISLDYLWFIYAIQEIDGVTISLEKIYIKVYLYRTRPRTRSRLGVFREGRV